MAAAGSVAPEPKVLIIGLDSADAELIDQWCGEGYLPTFAALRREGTWARVGTTAEVMHVSAWPSIYTGTAPGQHGLYHAYQARAGEQGVHRTRPEECAQPPFWKYLDEAGRKCIVMDAFMDYPLEAYRGIQVLEYGTWTWFTDPVSRPGPLFRDIVRRFGRYPAPEHSKVLTVPDPTWFRDRLVAGAAVKGRVVAWLLRDHPWHMAFATFGEPHAAGHYLWHVEDEAYASHGTGPPAAPPHPMRDVYAAIDRSIAHILEQLDDSVTVLVVSGDGMGPNYSGCHLMPEYLNRLGLFHSGHVGGNGGGGNGAARKGLLSEIRQAIPLSVRQAVTRCLPRSLHYRMSMGWVNADIDWARSQVFCVPNSNEAYLRVNLTGREPQGIVEPGEAYTDLLGSLRQEAQGLINPENGQPAAHKIFLTDDVFPGAQRRHLPDAVVAWNPAARILGEMDSPRTGRIQGKAGHEVAPFYTGNHRPNAFVLARGPHVAQGRSLLEGHILDLAPTVFALLGVDPPGHLQGRAWDAFVGR